MRISPINNNINFGRVIQFKNITEPVHSKNNAKEIASVLEGTPSLFYTGDEAQRIRSFFKETIDDYEQFAPVLARRTKLGYMVIITGKDAKNVLDIEEKYRIDRDKFKHGSLKKQINLEKQQEERDLYISSIVENGIDERPDTIITVKSGKYSYNRVSEINYSSYVKTQSTITDGFVSEKSYSIPDISQRYGYNTFYENKTISFEA